MVAEYPKNWKEIGAWGKKKLVRSGISWFPQAP